MPNTKEMASFIIDIDDAAFTASALKHKVRALTQHRGVSAELQERAHSTKVAYLKFLQELASLSVEADNG